MNYYGTAFVGVDVSKARNAIAIANEGRQGEIRHLDEIPNTKDATRKLVAKRTLASSGILVSYFLTPPETNEPGSVASAKIHFLSAVWKFHRPSGMASAEGTQPLAVAPISLLPYG